MNDEQIYELARAAGLSRDWISANGQPMQVAPHTLRRILSALDFPCETEAQCRDSLQRLNDLESSSHLPPLVTATVGQPIRLPATSGLAGKAYRIELENGRQLDGRFADDATGVVMLPAIDDHGYHHLHLDHSTVTLAVAPPRCFSVQDAMQASGAAFAEHNPRLWGLGVQLYALQRPGDGGIGDFTSLAQLARTSAAHGAAAVAISPVHAMFSADVTRFSPYGPSSRLFINALHIDPVMVAGQGALAAVLASLGHEVRDSLQQLERQELIDWPQAAKLRLTILRHLYEQFAAQGHQAEFEQFRSEGGDALRDHARFEALHAARLGNSEYAWQSWPEDLRHPKGIAVERFAQEHEHEVRFHEFLQWQAAKGLSAAQQAAREAGMPIGLIADLAVGADNGGSQAWSRQGEIIDGLSVGAPPDALNARGQSWGLGAFSPHAMRAKGFGAYIEMLRATFAYAGGARIDHVLGLSRLWLVPHGADATEGAYLQYPLQDLLRLIALESWRHKSIVIGEDLGTVPPGFDETLADAGLLGIRVLLFQQQHGRFLPPSQWPDSAIATTTTHDLPTVAGWWRGRDIDWRTQLDLLEAGQTELDARHSRDHERSALWQALVEAGVTAGEPAEPGIDAAPLDAAIGFMAATPAPLAILPIEDALGLVEQPNLPGTIDTHPNWRRRLPQATDQLLDQVDVVRRLAAINHSRSYRRKT